MDEWVRGGPGLDNDIDIAILLGQGCPSDKGATTLTQCETPGQTTTPGTPCTALYDKCVYSVAAHAIHGTVKMQETRPRV